MVVGVRMSFIGSCLLGRVRRCGLVREGVLAGALGCKAAGEGVHKMSLRRNKEVKGALRRTLGLKKVLTMKR